MTLNKHKLIFFIGSYTEMITSDFGGSGNGIYTVSLNLDTGKVEILNSYMIRNPAYLTVNDQMLYAITEVEDYKYPKVSTLKIGKDYTLNLVNDQMVEGSLPCHINSKDKALLVSCYGSGNVLFFPLDNEGCIKVHHYNYKHVGKSVNSERQEGPHAHQAVFHPKGTQVFVPDLGIDKIKVYSLKNDEFIPSPQYDVSIPPGHGPRHMVFNKEGNLGYVMNELSGDVAIIKLQNDRFSLHKLYKSLPESFNDLPSGAAIRLHPNGKYLYVANRTINALTIFEIYEDELQILDYQYTQGKTLREFNITPDGNWLIACLQDSNEVISYTISASGLLEDKSRTNSIGSPVCVCFI